MLSVKENKLGSLKGKMVLDFGAGAGRHAYWAYMNHADVVAVDISYSEVGTVRQYFDALLQDDPSLGHASVVQASGLDLPFGDEVFDVVIASEVFEHIADDRGAMAEISRVLKSGGLLAMSVPRFFPELIYWLISSEYHNVPGGHIRIYRRGQLKRLISLGGLTRYASHHAHALHTPYWLIRCLVGVTNTESRTYQLYHRFLVWDITKKPRSTAFIERILNPIAGKSLVMYAKKDADVS